MVSFWNAVSAFCQGTNCQAYRLRLETKGVANIWFDCSDYGFSNLPIQAEGANWTPGSLDSQSLLGFGLQVVPELSKSRSWSRRLRSDLANPPRRQLQKSCGRAASGFRRRIRLKFEL